MSKDFHQHLERLGQVFDRLRKANLKPKAEKCHLFKRRVKFLGGVVSEAGIEPDPEKVWCGQRVATSTDVERPTSVRSLCELLPTPHPSLNIFADIARPLHDLTKKNQPFIWDLPPAPILALPKSEGEYILDTDACNEASGAVLQQRQGKEIKVIAYASRILQLAEQSY